MFGDDGDVNVIIILEEEEEESTNMYKWEALVNKRMKNINRITWRSTRKYFFIWR